MDKEVSLSTLSEITGRTPSSLRDEFQFMDVVVDWKGRDWVVTRGSADLLIKQATGGYGIDDLVQIKYLAQGAKISLATAYSKVKKNEAGLPKAVIYGDTEHTNRYYITKDSYDDWIAHCDLLPKRVSALVEKYGIERVQEEVDALR